MLNLQHMGCHNINLVTPSHVVPQILAALLTAVKHGLEIPLVYNSSGYDDVETLKLLDGIIDIYMPDFKFWDSDVAEQSCGASDYPEIARQAIKEMYRQVGDLHIVNGRAVRGLLIRHLVLPLELAGTKSIVRFISREISPYTYVNIMGQYHPDGNATESEIWGSRITEKDYRKALEYARQAGLTRLD
jgi:putative pyruvate formate lyase activating enzyme